jgi:hypothetical protein
MNTNLKTSDRKEKDRSDTEKRRKANPVMRETSQKTKPNESEVKVYSDAEPMQIQRTRNMQCRNVSPREKSRNPVYPVHVRNS